MSQNGANPKNGQGPKTTGKLGLRSIKPQTTRNEAEPVTEKQPGQEVAAVEPLVGPATEPEDQSGPISLAGLIPDLETPVPDPEDAAVSLAALLPEIESQSQVVPADSEAPVSLAGLIPDLVADPPTSPPVVDPEAGAAAVVPAKVEAEIATAAPAATGAEAIIIAAVQEAVAVVPEATSTVLLPQGQAEAGQTVAAPMVEAHAEETRTTRTTEKVETKVVTTAVVPPQPQAQIVQPQPIVQPVPAPVQQIVPAAQPLVQYTPVPEVRPKPIPIKKTMPTKFAPVAPETTEIEETEKGKGKGKSKKKRTLNADFDRVKLDYQFHRIVQQLEVQPSLETPLLIGVTSTLRGEGRTTVAMGLASAISQEIPLPVILIETDLTHPTLAEDLGIDQQGLSEYLRGDIELDDLVQSTSLADLAVIVGGDCKGQALKLLRSERLSELIHSLSYQFAAIVVDLPPMSMTGEAARVINQLDRVLMVVEAGSTPNRLVKTALELIPEEKIMGVLLNRTRPAFGFFQWVKRLFR
jgi:Mrp family chromosome partitioning ATPase